MAKELKALLRSLRQSVRECDRRGHLVVGGSRQAHAMRANYANRARRQECHAKTVEWALSRLIVPAGRSSASAS